MLIETLPAAFQMEEILYELREHSAGLNCGRWDYIFSLWVDGLRSCCGGDWSRATEVDGQYQEAEGVKEGCVP